MVTVLFANIGNPNASIFDPRLTNWITVRYGYFEERIPDAHFLKVFYSIAVAQNIITTGLIAFAVRICSSYSGRRSTSTMLEHSC
jgi:hypothetical protein